MAGSFLDAAKAAKDEAPHKHVCPECGRDWFCSMKQCDQSEARVCPSVACIDAAAHHYFNDKGF